jgi:hypothetical protein
VEIKRLSFQCLVSLIGIHILGTHGINSPNRRMVYFKTTSDNSPSAIKRQSIVVGDRRETKSCILSCFCNCQSMLKDTLPRQSPTYSPCFCASLSITNLLEYATSSNINFLFTFYLIIHVLVPLLNFRELLIL